jgi:hypothetical protein
VNSYFTTLFRIDVPVKCTDLKTKYNDFVVLWKQSCKGGWKAVAMIAFNRDDLGCCKLLHSTWKNDEKLRHVVLQEVGLSKDLLQTKPSSARRMKKAPRLYGII